MIFNRGKRTPKTTEPKTKSNIFEPIVEKKVTGTPSAASTNPITVKEEPPTRDAIFSDTPIIAKIDPPTGWAAFVAGPEKGRILALGYGETPIETASKKGSCKIHYDPILQQFSILNDSESRILQSRETFKIGSHTLMLIPLCKDGFDWRTS